LILNCIRLSAEIETQRAENMDGSEPAQETQEGLISPTFWTDHISANSEWEDFQATLRQVTLEQTSDTLCHMDPNLRFQFAPLQSRQPTEAPLTKRHIGIPGISARGNEGIDLGSQCKLSRQLTLGGHEGFFFMLKDQQFLNGDAY